MSEITLHGLLSNLENYLKYQRDEGLQRVEVDRSTLADLARSPESISIVSAQTQAPPAPIPLDLGSIDHIATYVSTCHNCPLCSNRTNTVPGEGKVDSPDILFIGDGPGAEEDTQGRPFVGPAGQLLTKMIEAMGYRREEVFITHLIKCCPPNNRAPLPAEMEACLPYLHQQIKFLKPKTIVGLGATAIKGLLGKTVGITRLRGTWQEYEGIPLMPTFHPSNLLRDPSKKKVVWQDLQLVLKVLGKEPPART